MPDQPGNNGSATEQAPDGLTPVQQLRLVRAVLNERGVDKGGRIAVAGIVLSANREGLAWASYRSLSREFHVRLDSIASAIREPSETQPGGWAIGRFLAIDGRGQRGSVRYRALPVAERSSRQSAALRSEKSSAPVSPAQRSPGGRQTYSSETHPTKLAQGDRLGFGSSQRKHVDLGTEGGAGGAADAEVARGEGPKSSRPSGRTWLGLTLLNLCRAFGFKNEAAMANRRVLTAVLRTVADEDNREEIGGAMVQRAKSLHGNAGVESAVKVWMKEVKTRDSELWKGVSSGRPPGAYSGAQSSRSRS